MTEVHQYWTVSLKKVIFHGDKWFMTYDQTYPSHQKSFFFFLLTTAVKLAE